MSTIAPALRTLLTQVAQVFPGGSYALGEPDGIGFIRSVTFDPKTSKRLSPILSIINDERIGDIAVSGSKSKPTVRVTFVPDTRADFATPFPLAEVRAALEEDS